MRPFAALFMAFLAVVSAVFVLFCAASPSGAEQTSGSTGVVVAWSGTVGIERAGGDKVEIEKPETVYEGDTVVTSKSSQAKLVMEDDSVLVLAADSSLTVKGYAVDASNNTRTVAVKVSGGAARFIVSEFFGGKGSGFSVETETAVVSVKAANFAVKYVPEGVTVFCVSGSVSVKKSDPEATYVVDVAAGSMVTVKKDETPTDPLEIKAEQLTEVLNDTELSVTALSDKADEEDEKKKDAEEKKSDENKKKGENGDKRRK